jgi:hypothetical protein
MIIRATKIPKPRYTENTPQLYKELLMRQYFFSTLLLTAALHAGADTNTTTNNNNPDNNNSSTSITSVPPAPPINPNYVAQPGDVIIGGEGYCAGAGCGANRINDAAINDSINTNNNNKIAVDPNQMPDTRDAEQDLGHQMEGTEGMHGGGNGGGRR